MVSTRGQGTHARHPHLGHHSHHLHLPHLPSRRDRRSQRTAEAVAQTRRRHRRVLARVSVLVGFITAMVVYPVVGTLSPYASAGSAAVVATTDRTGPVTTATAILGAGPRFESSDLPLPTIDDEAGVLLTSNDLPVVSALLPDCDPEFDRATSNGRLSSDQLCSLWGTGEQLRPDAAIAFAELNERFRTEFGTDLCLADTYRTIAEQYATKATRGYLAATPGTSMHGLGLAIDLCRTHASGRYFQWLSEHAGTFGYWNPDWAKTTKYEPWHWEYKPGASEYQSYWGND